MSRSTLIACVALTALAVCQPVAAQDCGLPNLDELKTPTVKQLLTEPAVDWVVLKGTNKVIICEPVTPRPETLKKKEQALEAAKKLPGRTPDERKIKSKAFKDSQELVVFVEGEEYTLEIGKIEQVIHHEDLLLRRIELLQDEGKLRQSFEMLFTLRRRHPRWPGIDKTQSRLLLFEAKKRFADGGHNGALVMLEELHARDKKFAGLQEQLGTVVDTLTAAAMKKRDWRQARHFLYRLRNLEPRHGTYIKWSGDLQGQAQKLYDQARQHRTDGKHDLAVDFADKAMYIWPDTPGLKADFDQMSLRWQVLKVGTLHLPGEKSPYFVPTPADRRADYLQTSRLYEVSGVDHTVRYETRYFEQWEPTDLGRRTVITLRRDLPYYMSQQKFTAADVAATIRDRLNRASPRYDERLASYVDSLTVLSPLQLEIRFSRVPPRMESLFRFPLEVAASRETSTAAGDKSNANEPASLAERFKVLPNGPSGFAAFRRAIPEPHAAPRHHVAEVLERKYDTMERAIQGLLRGEVSMIPHLRPWEVNKLKVDVRYHVRKYATPTTHVLLFNRNSTPMKNRELRRALEYSLDRPQMMRDLALRDKTAEHGRVISGPFFSGSYADRPLVEQRDYDIYLGLALTLGAKSFLKKHEKINLPVLKMYFPPGEVEKAVAEKMVEIWKRIGINVQLVTAGDWSFENQPPDWDIIYRSYKMYDPVTELWPFLMFEDRARVLTLAYLPDWLRQELIQVDQARDWQAAVEALRSLHEHLSREVHVVPLWEIDDYLIVRRNVRGYRQRPVTTYDGIESWVVNPWHSSLED